MKKLMLSSISSSRFRRGDSFSNICKVPSITSPAPETLRIEILVKNHYGKSLFHKQGTKRQQTQQQAGVVQKVLSVLRTQGVP